MGAGEKKSKRKLKREKEGKKVRGGGEEGDRGVSKVGIPDKGGGEEDKKEREKIKYKEI